MDFANPAVLFGTGAIAIFALIGAFWSRLRVFFTKLFSCVIVPVDVIDPFLASAVIAYMNDRGKRSPLGIRAFTEMHIFLRPKRRYQHVAFEALGQGGMTFWFGWRPVWISYKDTKSKEDGPKGQGLISPPVLSIRFIRFTFPLTYFIVKGAGLLNDFVNRLSAMQEFIVEVIHGKVSNGNAEETSRYIDLGSGSSAADDVWKRSHCPIGWEWSDLGPEQRDRPLDFLVLGPDHEQVLREIQYWLRSEDWFKDRGLPWRRGYLLHGKPGTGKTSFIRAVAEDYNLPVFIFDLASLNNSQFVFEWARRTSRGHARVMVIEDIDGVFRGRNNVAQTQQRQGVTFDCLLNQIDGVERQDGNLLFITTNNPQHLDEALGSYNPKDKTVVSRPGRIDRVLEFGLINEAGRRQIMKRVLDGVDVPEELINALLESGAGDTPAQWQERCFQVALSIRFEEDQRE